MHPDRSRFGCNRRGTGLHVEPDRRRRRKPQAKPLHHANGFTDGTNHVTVTVNTPPVNGPNTGTTGFVEAIVSQPVSEVFLGTLGFSSRYR